MFLKYSKCLKFSNAQESVRCSAQTITHFNFILFIYFLTLITVYKNVYELNLETKIQIFQFSLHPYLSPNFSRVPLRVCLAPVEKHFIMWLKGTTTRTCDPITLTTIRFPLRIIGLRLEINFGRTPCCNALVIRIVALKGP